MTYKVNGTEVSLQPTEGRWLPRKRIAYSGSGHSVYVGVREFQLSWQLVSPSDFNQIQDFFNTVGTTGTVVVSLPKYGSSSYEFEDYTGCVIHEPEAGRYFTENQEDVLLLISNIRT